ncbi:MAG: hypothetical protein HRS50_02115 [Mycoplasmataceae bacterium]|nr:hypothetical protein [Mycoplasmataceae bacterium]
MIPLLTILIYFTIIQFKIVISQQKYKKALIISPDKFNVLTLNEVGTDYRVPRGQIPFFTYDVSNMEIGQKERKYIGNTKSGIKLPFMNLSLQNKTFIEGSTYEPWGITRVTITNRLIRLVANGDTPIKREIRIPDIDQIKLINSDKRVQITSRGWAWPIRLTFNSKQQAEEFQNACWTIFFEYHAVKRPKKILKKGINRETTIQE